MKIKNYHKARNATLLKLLSNEHKQLSKVYYKKPMILFYIDRLFHSGAAIYGVLTKSNLIIADQYSEMTLPFLLDRAQSAYHTLLARFPRTPTTRERIGKMFSATTELFSRLDNSYF